MTDERSGHGALPLEDVAAELQQAAVAKKCWACGCLHGALETIDRVLPAPERPAALAAALTAARTQLTPVRYDCLGCEVCFPARAVNAIHENRGELLAAQACPTEPVEARAGWPPLAGAYRVLRYQAPVAVCTLTDDGLAAAVAREADSSVAIVGTLQTENLGIERLIQNVLSTPHIRFVVVCGADSRQAIGHLPGQSLIALARHGLDGQARILQAPGKRPVLKNIALEAVEHFRQTVEVIDLVGHADLPEILDTSARAAARDPGPAASFMPERINVSRGSLPSRMVPDPAGYFVIYPDRRRNLVLLEHYSTDGVLDAVIEGSSAAELYTPAIAQGLLTRRDHAAYLGRELARAEAALVTGAPYVQDAAAETVSTSGAKHACCAAPTTGNADDRTSTAFNNRR